MTDEELADAVVALGVASKIDDSLYFLAGENGPYLDQRHNIDYGYIEGFSANQLVHGWRVAGALMERTDRFFGWFSFNMISGEWLVDPDSENAMAGHPGANILVSNESLPRAIIEACVEALK